jgi:hypothetical protein
LAWLAPGRLVESLQALRGPTPTTCCFDAFSVEGSPLPWRLDNRNYSRVSFPRRARGKGPSSHAV